MKMNLENLPDDILVNIIKNYLNLNDIIQLSYTCRRIFNLINNYHLWNIYTSSLPIIDFACANSDYNQIYHSRERLETYLKWQSNKYRKKLFYSFEEKMLPHIQIERDKSAIHISEANQIVSIGLHEIRNYLPTKLQEQKLNRKNPISLLRYKKSKSPNKNDEIIIHTKVKLFDQSEDISGFVKKENVFVGFNKNKITADEQMNDGRLVNLFQDTNLSYKINCADFSNSNKKLVYATADGWIKIFCIPLDQEKLMDEPLISKNIQDRILRCVISPSLNNLAIGTAGVRPYKNETVPLRIYDFERLKELQLLRPSPNKAYKYGAGILALSYIDDSTLMAAGYDTFIRIFDLRSNKCVQELEEPEDMSIYCVCVSQSYGLLSGNDRQSIIRYFDRRNNRLINTFTASNSNSSIYSLDCTPDCIYAGWEHGVTAIDLIH